MMKPTSFSTSARHQPATEKQTVSAHSPPLSLPDKRKFPISGIGVTQQPINGRYVTVESASSGSMPNHAQHNYLASSQSVQSDSASSLSGLSDLDAPEQYTKADYHILQDRVANRMLPNPADQKNLPNVRKRVHEVVIEKKNRSGRQYQPAVTAKGSATVGSRLYKCQGCGTIDQGKFVVDQKSGDIVCTDDGVIVDDSIVHTGPEFRKFEGEADRNHHGAPANHLLSEQFNLSTSLRNGAAPTPIAGVKPLTNAKVLSHIHKRIEAEVSNYGMTSKETSVNYMDKQKIRALQQLSHAGDSLQIHHATVERAKALYAAMRDFRILLRENDLVIAACLIEAIEEHQGNQQLEPKIDEQNIKDTPHATPSRKAQRRAALHYSAAASKPSIVSNISETKPRAMSHLEATTKAMADRVQETVKTVPLGRWSMTQCRDWLIHTSEKLALQKAVTEFGSQIQMDSPHLNELQGTFVSHALTLTDFIEAKLLETQSEKQSIQRAPNTRLPQRSAGSALHISTPHIATPHTTTTHKSRPTNSPDQPLASGRGERTAGKLLLLTPRQVFIDALQDKEAGTAFHRAVRGLATRQRSLNNVNYVSSFIRARAQHRAALSQPGSA